MGVIPIHPPGALPEPATPALAGVEWWTGREGALGRAAVLEHQRKMDGETIADQQAMIEAQAATIAGQAATIVGQAASIADLYEAAARSGETIIRLRGDLARAGLALDALTAPEATS